MVYYHGKDEFLAFSGRMGHKIFKGKKIQTQVRVQDVHQLSRRIHDEHDHDGSGEHEIITCRHHKYDECMYHKLKRMMQDATEDNCTVPWILNNSRICRKPKDIKTAFETPFLTIS